MNKFKSGDKVVRVIRSFGSVVLGGLYTVEGYGVNGLLICGLTGEYDEDYFELHVDKHPKITVDVCREVAAIADEVNLEHLSLVALLELNKQQVKEKEGIISSLLGKLEELKSKYGME